jgi:uncharacterized membrane protein
MNVDVVSEVLIDRPCGDVSRFAADPDNAPKWYANIKAVQWRTDRPLRVGAQIAFVAHFLGRHLEYTYEVAEWQPGDRLVMRTADGPFPMETSYTWWETPDGQTAMTLRNKGTPKGFSRWIAPLISLAMRRANRQDLDKLKAVMESHRAAP